MDFHQAYKISKTVRLPLSIFSADEDLKEELVKYCGFE